MTHWMGLPALASAHGAQIDSLIGWTHVFMLVLFVGWGGFFGYALVAIGAKDIAFHIKELKPPYGQGRITELGDWRKAGPVKR